MAELGYDLSTPVSTSLAEIPDGEFEAVVMMGCGDACPFAPAKQHIDWQIPDPKAMEAADFARVRDRIREEVTQLLA